MLSTSPIIGFVPTQDAAAAHRFYRDVLGLQFVSDDEFAIVMQAHGNTIRIVRVGKFTPMPFTILGWEVEDIEATVADLTARGLAFCRYAFLKQEESGVWNAPAGAKVAWFLDPDGNTLSLSQH